jgi:ArsR family transcriptional regulator, arsenate/arsenite/antimonite-responsive transcriptional repressor
MGEQNGKRTGRREEVNELVTIFKALSDETRLRILKLLEQGELCVCDIVAAFDTIQPKISFHLASLKAAGLVKDRKEGKWMHYRIDDSDLFKRLIILSVMERIPGETLKEDTERLKEFLTNKNKVVPLQGACCARKVNQEGG